MNSYTEKSHHNQRREETANAHAGGAVAEFVSQRPEAIAQRNLQQQVNSSPRLQQLKASAELVNHNQQGKQTAQLQAMAAHSGMTVLQRYPTIDDSGRTDAVIYIIYKNNGKTDDSNVLYVGQTTLNREFTRFQEHVSRDSWAPWYIHATKKGLDYSVARDSWPYDYVVVENLKNVTKFETTVAEQWWMEHYLKQGRALLNDSTPCTLSNFNKRSVDSSLYDPSNIGVKGSYKPSMTAK